MRNYGWFQRKMVISELSKGAYKGVKQLKKIMRNCYEELRMASKEKGNIRAE